jgi:toxin ParE1/3/4
MGYRISEGAEFDLDEIFLGWAERAGLKIADRIVDEIVERFRLLGEFPEAGRSSNEIAMDVKSFPAGKYLIYYRRSGEYTEILYIFHGAREQAKAFKKARKYRR